MKINKRWLIALLFLATVGAFAQFGAGRILNYAYWLVDQVGSTPSNPTSGKLKVYSKSADGKMYKLDSSGVESEIGSGAGGGKNFFTRTGTTADYVATGNNATFDGGGTLDGTFSISTTAADLIDDVNQINVYKYVHGATSTNDYLASSPIDIPLGFSGRVIGYEFYYKYDGADDDMEWEVKCTTDGTILSDQIDATLDACSPSDNVACKYSGFVFVPSTCTQLEMGPSVAVGNSGSIFIWDELKIADDLVQTSKLVEMTAWEAFTPTGSWSTNVTHTGFKRRVGDTLEVTGFISLSGAPDAVTLTMNLPSGLTIDTAKMGTVASLQNPLGQMTTIDSSGNDRYQGRILYTTTTAVIFSPFVDGSALATFEEVTVINHTTPMTYASGDNVYYNYKVPIVGWDVTSDNVNSATDSVSPIVYEGAAGTSVGSGLDVVIDLAAKLQDSDNLVTTGASWVYTVPKTGWYTVSAKIKSSSTTAYTDGNSSKLIIYKNGSSYRNLDDHEQVGSPGSNVQMTLQGTRSDYYTKGDTIQIRVFQNSGSSINFSGDTASWITIVREDKSPITNIPHAIKFQTKYLSADVTSAGEVSDLTFTGITVGRCYRITGGFAFLVTSGVGNHTLYAYDGDSGGVLLGRIGLYTNYTSSQIYFGWGTIYKATNTTLEFYPNSVDADELILGDGTKAETWVTLEELPVCHETTEF